MQNNMVRAQFKAQVILVIIACVGSLVSSTQNSFSQTPVSPTRRPSAGNQLDAQTQEALVQHLISGALSQDNVDRPPHTTAMSRKTAQRNDITIEKQKALVTPDLTSATITMVIALGVIISLLAIGAYLIRRYLLKPTMFGKGEPVLRVLARTNLTPKATIALVEVPGKLLVIGASGNNLIPLGETQATKQNGMESQEQNPESSFEDMLHEQCQTLYDHDQPNDHLLRMSEEIQRKVSRLKQL